MSKSHKSIDILQHCGNLFSGKVPGGRQAAILEFLP
jgi:hypothetical protein